MSRITSVVPEVINLATDANTHRNLIVKVAPPQASWSRLHGGGATWPHASVISTKPGEAPVRTLTEWDSSEASERSTKAAAKKAATGRRRKVDPTTTDRQYTPAEVEFMNAMSEYKRRSGRQFPTWSEVLEVLLELGYGKGESQAEAA